MTLRMSQMVMVRISSRFEPVVLQLVSCCACLHIRPTQLCDAGCFREAGGWQAVVRKPFSGGSTTLSIPVEIRHERDPYLYFLDISNGSLNFGLTTGEVCGILKQ